MTDDSECRGAKKPIMRLIGQFRPPGDKSVSHRALILAGLAQGQSLITGLNPGQDCLATQTIMTRLGARFSDEPGGLRVSGIAGRPIQPEVDLDCGNSGTTARLLMGVAAATPGTKRLTGDSSLSRRPMARVAGPLASMGAAIDLSEGRFLPAVVTGKALRAHRHEEPVFSAQVKSAILLAGVLTEGLTEVLEEPPTRDHTERLLEHFGVPVESDGRRVAVRGAVKWSGREVRVPGDISAAVFPLVAALVRPGSRVTALGVGVNPTRRAALEVLERMGAGLSQAELENAGGAPEETADVTMVSSELTGTVIEGRETAGAIDEIPILAVAACFACGRTEIRDAAELRVKESDRISGLVQGLKALGARVEERPDGLVVEGGGTGFRFSGGAVDSHGDHRLAMSFAVAALAADGKVQIDGLESFAVSDPGFFQTLKDLETE